MVTVFSQSKKFRPLEKKIRKTARKALRELKPKKAHVEFFLISDQRMRGINKKFRGKDKATNVLSFEEPKDFNDKEKNKMGEIYIAPDFIRKNKQSLEHMVVHGILHLCGYDHVRAKDAQKMEKKEHEIRRKL